MPGTDQMINYQLRPSKSVERKMMCDLIKEIQIIEGKQELRYIGMGAKYFTDFLLLHNEFGISDMISIESEAERQIRYEFNKPLKCIQMRYGTTNEVLPQIENFNEKTNLVWLDYDDSFSDDMLYDIETLCRNLMPGSMFFISCNYSFRGDKTSEKQENFKCKVNDYFDVSIEQIMYTNKKIPLVIRELVFKQINKTLEMRNRTNVQTMVKFSQLLFLTYKDGAPMLTFGGILVDNQLQEKLIGANLFDRYSFLSETEKYFSIEIPKLTNKEIQVILKNIPITKEEYENSPEIFYGISYDEIQKFSHIYRYYPYFSEGNFIT